MMLSNDLLTKAVRRNNHYNDVVSILVNGTLSGEFNSNKIKIFNNIKDVIVFAAFVGEYFDIKEMVNSKDSTGITLQTFGGSGSGKDSNIDQHNLIFMMSLLTHEDMNMIRDEKVNEAIELFELYSNGGLSKIKSWLVSAAWNPMILLDKIIEELPDNNTGVGPINPF